MATVVGSASVTDAAIRYAVAQVGKPYVWGAEGPDSFDCSGLVFAAFKQAGKTLPRVTGLLIMVGTEVKKADLQPGDLVFPDPGHVQIYLGGGKIVEAPETGKNVRVVPMWGFWRARRVSAPGTATNGDAQGFNPIGAATGAVDDAKTIVTLLGKLSDPHLWLRIATLVTGALLMLFGLARLK